MRIQCIQEQRGEHLDLDPQSPNVLNKINSGGLSPQSLLHGEARSVCPEARAERRSWSKRVKRRDMSSEQQSDQELTASIIASAGPNKY